MSRSEDIGGIIAMRGILGTGSIAKIPVTAGQIAVTIKLEAGGTLEIGGLGTSLAAQLPSPFSGATILAGGGTFITGNTFGQMYFLSANEVFSGNVSGPLYLFASGATCSYTVAFGRTSGV